MNKQTLIIGAMIIFLFSACALAEDLSTRVNIALDDGTVMIYAGTKKGVNIGDEFDVIRSGERAGHIRVVRTKDLFSYCEIIDGAVQEMDTVVRVKVGTAADAAAAAKTPSGVKTTSGETPAETGGEASDTQKTKTTAVAGNESSTEATQGTAADGKSGSVRTSPRRESAKIETETKPGTESGTASAPASESGGSKEPLNSKRGGDKTVPADKNKTTESGKTASTAPAADEKKRGLSPIGTPNTAAFGLSGVIFIPSANVQPAGKITGMVAYASASDENNDFTDTGFGVNYGFSGDMEAAFMYVANSYNMPGQTNLSLDGNTSILSLKYQLPQTKPPSFIKQVKEARFAAGLQFFSMKIDAKSNTFSASVTGKATRLYAVGTGVISKGTGHLGIFTQNGDLVNDSDNKGLGLMAGYEYPLASGSKSAMDQMTLLFELDSKSIYLDTYRTLSLGLRYALSDAGHVTLSVADITSAKAITLSGAYSFK
ncbi:MAG: hypothetical protein WCX65_03785 [bacterium]